MTIHVIKNKNFVSIPNVVIDYWVKKISSHSYCIFVYLFRLADGGGYESYFEFIKKNKINLNKCFDELEKLNLIIRKKNEFGVEEIILNYDGMEVVNE